MRAPGAPWPYLTPLATLLGLGLVAAALYTTRSAGPPPGLAPPPTKAAAGLERPPPRAAPSAVPPTGPALRDLFRPHLHEAAERCGLDAAIASDPEVVVAELPLSLVIDPDGRVAEAAPAGEGQVIGPDGTTQARDFGAGRAHCYADFVKAWIRFPPPGQASRLQAPLRVLEGP